MVKARDQIVGCGTRDTIQTRRVDQPWRERRMNSPEHVDAVARKNVELTMAEIHGRSAIIAALETKSAVKIAGAMYNLESATVDFLTFTPKTIGTADSRSA